MAILPVTLLNGTTADADDVMDDFVEIYTNITNVNIAAAAGIVFSKLDSLTVAGVTAAQTLTNKTLTAPTITGTLTAAIANFTGAVAINGGLTLAASTVLGSTLTIYDSSSGIGSQSTLSFKSDEGDGPSTERIRFEALRDGSANTGMLKIYANNSGMTEIARIDHAGKIGVGTTPLTGIHLASGTAAGSTLRIDDTSAGIGSAATISLFTDESDGLLERIRFEGLRDGAGNGKLQISTLTASVVSNKITINNTGEVLLPNVDPPTANYANRNGIVKAYLNMAEAGTTPNDSYNISSVSHVNGTGQYIVNFNTDFANTNYTMIATRDGGGGAVGFINCTPNTAGQCFVDTFNNAGVATDKKFYLLVMGDQ